jgi:non-canonical purine NTP pyrophosphatase (RdgB/HAM1 family)
MKTPVFITGNQNKADYLAKLLGMPIDHQKIELDEIQSKDIAEVVTHKVKQAYEIAGKPVLVEDVSLEFTALDGLPGPFVKFFVDSQDGLEMMCRMLDGFSDRHARAECMYGYYDGERLELFRGELDGAVADHPRGDGGFGWDKVFCPDGYGGRTRAELNEEEYLKLYEVIKPIGKVRQFLQNL